MGQITMAFADYMEDKFSKLPMGQITVTRHAFTRHKY